MLFDDVLSGVISITKRSAIDTIGVMVVGSSVAHSRKFSTYSSKVTGFVRLETLKELLIPS